MTITPKSPEDVLRELEEMTQPYCASGCGCYQDGLGPAHEGRCVTKCNSLEEREAWLRTSLASILLWVKEEIPKGDNYPTDRIIGFNDCRSLLQKKAEEIMNDV